MQYLWLRLAYSQIPLFTSLMLPLFVSFVSQEKEALLTHMMRYALTLLESLYRVHFPCGAAAIVHISPRPTVCTSPHIVLGVRPCGAYGTPPPPLLVRVAFSCGRLPCTEMRFSVCFLVHCGQHGWHERCGVLAGQRHQRGPGGGKPGQQRTHPETRLQGAGDAQRGGTVVAGGGRLAGEEITGESRGSRGGKGKK